MDSTKRELQLYKDKMSYYKIKAEQYKRKEASPDEQININMLVNMREELDKLLSEAEALRTERERIFEEMPSPYNTLMYQHYISFIPINDLKVIYNYSEQHLRRLLNEGVKLYKAEKDKLFDYSGSEDKPQPVKL